MDYPTPGRDEILIRPSDEVPFAIAFAIKAATEVDIYTAPPGESMAALAWWNARVLPQYTGLTFDYVREHWSLAQLKVVSSYVDAADVVESAALLPVEPDPVIPEDGAGFPVVDPPADGGGTRNWPVAR